MDSFSLPSGPFKDQPLTDVPLLVLFNYYKKAKFSKPSTHKLREALKNILLASGDPEIIKVVQRKELDDLLLSALDKKIQQEKQEEEILKKNLRPLIQQINHSPNLGYNGSLDVDAFLDDFFKARKKTS